MNGKERRKSITSFAGNILHEENIQFLNRDDQRARSLARKKTKKEKG
jgi:hypothetical protein